MKMLSILLCAMVLSACSGKPPEPQARTADVATPFDALKADKQRAREVQQATEKRADEQRRQIEAQAQ